MSSGSGADEPSQRYVEDSPQMRSVAMVSRQPLTVPSPRSFGLAKKTSQSSPVVTAVNPVVPKNALLPMSATTSWKVNQLLLPLPTNYLLERTNIYVADLEPQKVADNISDCLRKESISATYDDEEATVEAETMDNVEFFIRLFRDKDCVVVEVQRSAGCGYSFHQCCSTVLRAAARGGGCHPQQQGGRQQQEHRRRRPFTPPRSLPIPAGIPRDSSEQEEDRLQEGLTIAFDLLKKRDRLDCQQIAVESLVQMTATSTAASSSVNCSRFCAAKILSDPNALEALVHLVVTSDGSSELEKKFDYCKIARRQALAVLANCFAALEDCGQLASLLATKTSNNTGNDGKKQRCCAPPLLRSDKLVTALVKGVESADCRPHDALQAVRCLCSLASACPEAKQQVLEAGAALAVRSSRTLQQPGLCRHVKLEEASHKLQRSLLGDL